MCDRRWAGNENERPHPGWSHLYGFSFSFLTSADTTMLGTLCGEGTTPPPSGDIMGMPCTGEKSRDSKSLSILILLMGTVWSTLSLELPM